MLFRTVSKSLHIIGQIFAVDEGTSLTHLFGMNSKLSTNKFD